MEEQLDPDRLNRSCLEKLFYKGYRLSFNYENVRLPDAEQLFTSAPWTVQRFVDLKIEMNNQKSRLNDYKLSEWRDHTYNTNYAKFVSRALRKNYNTELHTNAWIKFYECLSNIKVIPYAAIKNQKLNSVHLCEAPGAFITSLNHYIYTHHPNMQLKWMASSLNPYYEGNALAFMINDDRFIAHTLDNWNFGEDFTGNLMKWENSQYLIKKSREMGQIHLVTADGSIDCSQDPGEQEGIVSCLLYCETITALQLLTKGGSFVIKVFTIYEHSTINLIYFLCSYFESIDCFKPVMSKSGNSEVYIVCIGFQGMERVEPYLEKLREFYNPDRFKSRSILPCEKLPQEFLDDIYNASYFFHKSQYDIIGNNILLMNAGEDKEILFKKLFNVQKLTEKRFFKTYKFKAMTEDRKICPHLKSFNRIEDEIYKKRNSDKSYSDIINPKNKTAEFKYNTLRSKFKGLENNYFGKLPGLVNCRNLQAVKLDGVYGKPITNIGSSLYVNHELFQIFNEIVMTENIASQSHVYTVDKNKHSIQFNRYSSNVVYDVWEKSLLFFLRDKLSGMKNTDILEVSNFSPLTQFANGLLYVMMQHFSSVIFTNKGDIIFNCLLGKEKMLNTFDTIAEMIENSPKNYKLLSIVRCDTLLSSSIFSIVFYFNSNNLYQYCKSKIGEFE